jgi:hypothetical protein
MQRGLSWRKSARAAVAMRKGRSEEEREEQGNEGMTAKL